MDKPSAPPTGQSIFISYSRSDKLRVSGLGLLLEALGHRVFLDHKTILPGRDWKASLQEGLEQSEVLLVFWTKHSATSDWVRKEYEYFVANYPERMLVPVIGDETPLSEVLKKRQHSDFVPLVNELLDMKRSMEESGAKPEEIQKAVVKRLQEAGIELTDKQQKKLLRLFAPTGFLGLISTPLVLLQWSTNTGLEAIAQFSAAQLTIVGAAAISGAVICGFVDHIDDSDQPTEAENSAQNSKGGGNISIENRINEDGKQTTPTPATPLTTQPIPQGLNREQLTDCSKIDCDCGSIDAGLLTGPWKQSCRAAEAESIKKCNETGEIKGACSGVSGPGAWP